MVSFIWSRGTPSQRVSGAQDGAHTAPAWQQVQPWPGVLCRPEIPTSSQRRAGCLPSLCPPHPSPSRPRSADSPVLRPEAGGTHCHSITRLPCSCLHRPPCVLLRAEDTPRVLPWSRRGPAVLGLRRQCCGRGLATVALSFHILNRGWTPRLGCDSSLCPRGGRGQEL